MYSFQNCFVVGHSTQINFIHSLFKIYNQQDSLFEVLGTFPRHFPKGDFPSDNFPSGNFPNVQFPKRQLPKGQVRPSEAPQATMGGRALRQGWVGGQAHDGAERCGQDRLGKLPLGNLHIWEVATWEKILLKST